MAKKFIDLEKAETKIKKQCEMFYKLANQKVKPEDYFINRDEAYKETLFETTIEAFINFLKSQPAADVQEVRHGEWFISEYEYLTCSECGGSRYTGAESKSEAVRNLENGKYPKFCENCGAKMDGGENDE